MNDYDLPALPEEDWLKLLGPLPAVTMHLSGHFQPCSCDDCRMAAAQLTDDLLGYEE